MSRQGDTSRDTSSREKIPILPIEGVLSRVADFCDRKTFNRLALANKEMKEICLKKDKIPWPVLKLPPERLNRQRGLYLSPQDSNTLYHYEELQLHRWDRRSGRMSDFFVPKWYGDMRFSKDLRYFATFGFRKSYSNSSVNVYYYDLQDGSCDRYSISPPERQFSLVVYKLVVYDVAIRGDICLIDYRDGADVDEPLLVALLDLKTRQWVRMLRGVEADQIISLTNAIALSRGNFGRLQIWHYRNDQEEEPPYSFQLPDHQDHRKILDCIPHPTEERLFCLVSAERYKYESHPLLLHFGILEVHISDNSGSIDNVRYHPGAEVEDDEDFLCQGGPRKPDLMAWFPCGNYALYLSYASPRYKSVKQDRLFLLSFSRSTMKLLPVESESKELPRHVQRSFQTVNSFLDKSRSIPTRLNDLQIIVKDDGASICMSCSNGVIKIVDI